MAEPAFFDIPTYSPALARLHQIIGAGRVGKTDELVLQLSVAPADAPNDQDESEHHENTDESERQTQRELCKIELSLDGQTAYAWVDAAMLLTWLEPILPVPDLASLAPDLYPAALSHALTPWFDWCVKHRLVPPTIKALSPPESASPSALLTLSLIDPEESRWLNLSLDHFPLAWLTELAQSLSPQAQPTEQTVQIHASAGLARLSIADLRALAVGDVVMTSWQAPIEDGGLLLSIGTTWVQIQQLDEDHFKVENIMHRLDDETNFPSEAHTDESEELDLSFKASSGDAETLPHQEPGRGSLESAVASLPITLVFEIGRMSMPLSTLSELHIGDVLEADFKTTPEIQIRAQGQLIASATLVQIGERLGAKITQMIQ